MFFIYLLTKENSDFHYLGLTNSLSKRMKQHRSGQYLPTNEHWPLDLVYYEAYADKGLALKREESLKTDEGISELLKRLK